MTVSNVLHDAKNIQKKNICYSKLNLPVTQFDEAKENMVVLFITVHKKKKKKT